MTPVRRPAESAPAHSLPPVSRPADSSAAPSPATLTARATILRSLRATLDSAGFSEVETPVRIPAPANEEYIDCPPSGDAFLRASPELQMKRLLCAGCRRIYQIGPCFRQGEHGDRHNPEFTLLEWYRADAGSDEVLADLFTLCADAARAVRGTASVSFRGHSIDLSPTAWTVLSVRDAYLRWAGWDPIADYDASRFEDDMALVVEPALPRDRAVVLRGYPAGAASLARLLPEDPRVADRWEAYVGGMELCNAFGELTDAAVQRRRFEETARFRAETRHATPYPLDEAFLADLARGMPPSGGAALGVDRLCMVLLDAPTIADVRVL